MTQMRALVCSRLAPAFEGVTLKEIPVPVPGPESALIRIRATAINFPDVLMTAGGYQHKPDLPFVPGMEAAGEVAAVGPGGDTDLVGRPVIAGLRTGGLAEYALASLGSLRPIPNGFSFEEAAGFTTGALTAYVGLVRRGALKASETLLVHGAAGGMGLAAVQLGKGLGARVIATASTEEKRKVVAKAGADHALPATGFREEVLAITGRAGADVVFDPVGGDAFDESVRVMAWGGRLLVIGFASGRIPTLSANMALIKGFSLVGVRAGEYGRRDPEGGRENIAAIDALAAQGHLKPIVGARLPLERALDGLRLLAERKAIGKVVIVP